MNKKTQKKKQQKIVQDRTFGLKNKNKSKAVQKFVLGVEQTVKHHGKSAAMMQSEQFERRKQKKKQQEQNALLNALFNDAKKIGQMSDSDDEDPANTVCPYFKQGLCQKGKKCIYSHDLTLDRTQQIDLYVDQRTQLIMNAIGGKQLNQLSEQELNKMIGDKQKKMIKGARSDIVCKFFLQAAEKEKYGWNWNCPNGDGCKYKHCLPPGYKLRKDQTGKAKIEMDQVAIQQKIDEERNKLLSENRSSPLVTFQVFQKWKEERKLRKQKQAQQKKKEQQKKKGNKFNLRTGKQLFDYDRGLFVDDEEAADQYQKQQFIEEEEDNQEIQQNQGQNQEDFQQENYQEKNQETNQAANQTHEGNQESN